MSFEDCDKDKKNPPYSIDMSDKIKNRATYGININSIIYLC